MKRITSIEYTNFLRRIYVHQGARCERGVFWNKVADEWGSDPRTVRKHMKAMDSFGLLDCRNHSQVRITPDCIDNIEATLEIELNDN